MTAASYSLKDPTEVEHFLRELVAYMNVTTHLSVRLLSFSNLAPVLNFRTEFIQSIAKPFPVRDRRNSHGGTHLE